MKKNDVSNKGCSVNYQRADNFLPVTRRGQSEKSGQVKFQKKVMPLAV